MKRILSVTLVLVSIMVIAVPAIGQEGDLKTVSVNILDAEFNNTGQIIIKITKIENHLQPKFVTVDLGTTTIEIIHSGNEDSGTTAVYILSTGLKHPPAVYFDIYNDWDGEANATTVPGTEDDKKLLQKYYKHRTIKWFEFYFDLYDLYGS